MSFDSIPYVEALVNGEAIDAEKIQGAFTSLSLISRSFADDLLGRSSWLRGGGVTVRVEAEELVGEVEAGVAYVGEFADEVFPLPINTRTDPVSQEVEVPQATDAVLVALFAHNSADHLSALYALNSRFEAPPKGSIGLGLASSSFTEASVVEMRGNPWTGVRVEGEGQSVAFRASYVPVPDARVALILEEGEGVEVRIETTLSDGLLEEDLKREGEEILVQQTRFLLAINDTIVEEANDRSIVGPTTLVEGSHTMYAEWLFTPFGTDGSGPSTFLFGRTRGVVILQLMVSARSSDISSVRMIARVRPAEKDASR